MLLIEFLGDLSRIHDEIIQLGIKTSHSIEYIFFNYMENKQIIFKHHKHLNLLVDFVDYMLK
jgi:hypothetical protein